MISNEHPSTDMNPKGHGYEIGFSLFLEFAKTYSSRCFDKASYVDFVEWWS